MINKPKTSSIVASQLPEFVREDYPNFIAFLEAYYEFLEANTTSDFKSVRDLDDTLDSFLTYFKSELATNIPYTKVNERFLIENIKDQYLAKGSEASFKLLFRILFDKEITLSYPGRQMLRASDGKWNQDVSVFAKVNAGTPDMIVGKMVDVVTPSKIIRVLVDRRQDVEIEVDRVTQISPDVYEFFIDRRFFGTIAVSDRLRYTTIFDATIVQTTSKVVIQQGGRNFKIGQLYEIRNGDGVGSILKITSVDLYGSITSLEFVKFGIGYETDFTSTFLANTGQTTTGAGTTAFNLSGNNVGIFESTSGFSESGTIIESDYVADSPGTPIAWDGTYVGTLVREFYNDGSDLIVDPDEPAVIKIILGPLTKYPGYFINNDGFLDDAVFIQDSRYYQAFAYVVRIDERLETYKSAVKSLIHPSGMALFGEYDIRNAFDISVDLESMLKILTVAVQDYVSSLAYITAKDFGKAINTTTTDFLGAIDNESFSLSSETGTNSGRTVPFFGITKSILATTTDFLGAIDNESFSLSSETGTNSGRTVPFMGISKPIDATTLDYLGAIDNESFSLSSETGTNSGRTVPFMGIDKSILATTLDYLGAIDNESFSLSSEVGIGSLRTVPFMGISKPIDATTLDYLGAIDNESFALSSETGINGARTVPFMGIDKSILATTTDFLGAIDNESFSLSSETGINGARTVPFMGIDKSILATTTDFLGAIDDESISLSSEVGVGSLRTVPFMGIDKSILATTTDFLGAIDNESFSLSDEYGSGSLRTVPFFGITKSILATTLDYLGSIDNESFSLSDAVSFIIINKVINATTLNYLGSLDDETVISTTSGNLFFNPYMDFPDTYWDISYTAGTTSFTN